MTSETSSSPASSPSAPTDGGLGRTLLGPKAARAAPTPAPPAPAALIALPVLIWFGDRLLLAGRFGPPLPLLFLAIAVAVVAIRRRPPMLVPAALLGSALLALVETVNPITVGFGLAALAVFAIPPDRLVAATDTARLALLARLIGLGPFRAPFHLWRTAAAERSAGGFRRWLAGVLDWLWPVALALCFLVLFSYANPLVAAAFARFDPRAALADLSAWQVVLWLLLACFAWPFLRADVMAPHAAAADRPPRLVPATATVIRVLALSNAVFAVQTLADLIGLWPGIAGLGDGLILPEGKTFSEYAREGAYPLLVAACLAAAIILSVMRAEVPASRSPLAGRLIHVWIAQTLLLLASAALRLDLYVDAYALTRLRLAAFIWMALVAAGLGLIVLRLVLDRSNAWLVRANLSMLAGALAACGLVNFDRVIATYNIARSDLVVATGPQLDISYLNGLGPDAIPAIAGIMVSDRVDRQDSDARATLHALTGIHDSLLRCLAADLADWRSWSFRKWRLWRDSGNGVPLVPPVD